MDDIDFQLPLLSEMHTLLERQSKRILLKEHSFTQYLAYSYLHDIKEEWKSMK